MKKEKSERERCVHYIKLFGVPFCTYGTTPENLTDKLKNQPCSPKRKCPLEKTQEGENIMNHTNQIVMIPISRLEHHPKNPRKSLGDLSELAEYRLECLDRDVAAAQAVYIIDHQRPLGRVVKR